MSCRHQRVDGKDYLWNIVIKGLVHHQRVDGKRFVIVKGLTKRNVLCMHVVHVNENFSFW